VLFVVRPKIGTGQVVLLAGLAYAGGLDFDDQFDAFDVERWSRGDDQLSRSYLDPANVGVGAGYLRTKLPARSLEDGEIRSNVLYGYGTYSARMKLPNAQSSITGFFLYEPPDYASEIDVEIYNDSSRRMAFHSSSGRRQRTPAAPRPTPKSRASPSTPPTASTSTASSTGPTPSGSTPTAGS
jgi:beta-glucanase (GH16 family)